MHTTVKVPTMRVSVHMSIVAAMAGSMHLAVLVIAMARAVEMPAVWIAVHMTMMVVVAMPTLGLLQQTLRDRLEQSRGCCLCCRTHEGQRKGVAQQRYRPHLYHGVLLGWRRSTWPLRQFLLIVESA
ncbi:MAG: hypothetical protein WAO08_12685 [Hyphomicrobiaceae bacterium]